MPFKDARSAQKAAYIGGTLLFLTGGTGAVATVQLGQRLAESLPAGTAQNLEPVFLVAAFIAALGGISVVVGGFFLTRRRVFGKILLILGASVGVITFALQLVTVLIAGFDSTTRFIGTATTVQGLAVLFVVYAQLRA